jgi:hypothetical protein
MFEEKSGRLVWLASRRTIYFSMLEIAYNCREEKSAKYSHV